MMNDQIDETQRPLVGVMVNNFFMRTLPVNAFARKLIQANEITQLSLYFFTPFEINWSRKMLKMHYFDPEKQSWLSDWAPFPDIIYDRGVGFGKTNSLYVEGIRHRFLRMPDIQFINSCRLEKWKVHKCLQKHEQINDYLPRTFRYQNMEQINKLLTPYNTIFLKSSGGSSGKGVLSMEKKNQGVYVSFYQKGSMQKKFISFGSLKNYLQAYTSDGIYIVQQGINLVRYRGRPVDLRVLLVKNNRGEWNNVYNQARIAPQGSVITNLSLGGTVKNYTDIYPQLSVTYPRVPAHEEICEISIKIAGYIEMELGPFGEIGMDMAVDERGQIWFLEANSKPSKLPEKELEDTLGISPQFLMILEYAVFLFNKQI